MADDIDIEEHDVLDNPRIKNIFPDLTTIKTEAPDVDDQDDTMDFEYENDDNHMVSFRDAIRFEESEVEYPRYKNKIILGSKPCTSYDVNSPRKPSRNIQHEKSSMPIFASNLIQTIKSEPLYDGFDDMERQVFHNPSPVIILGSRPNRQRCEERVEINETHSDEMEVENLNAVVLLEDWGPRLERSSCYCKDCEILFPTRNCLDFHKASAHSFLVALNTNRAVKSTAKSADLKNTARKSTGPVRELSTSKAKFCNHCNKTFPDDTALITHLYKILPGDKFVCDKCNAVFKQEAELQAHIATHDSVLTDSASDGYYRCNVCSCYFRHKVPFVRHMLKSHAQKVTDFHLKLPFEGQCLFCVYIGYSKKCYNRHIQKVHRNLNLEKGNAAKATKPLLEAAKVKLQPFKCLQNPVKSSKLSHSTAQRAKALQKTVARILYKYQCNQCDEILPSYYSARQHKDNVHPEFKNRVLYNRVAIRKIVPIPHTQNVSKPSVRRPVAKTKPVIETLINPPIPIDILFKCNHCRIHFTNCTAALVHSRNCLKYKGDWRCQQCRRTFKFNDKTIHEHQHEVSERFNVYLVNETLYGRVLCQCPHCDLYFHEKEFWAHLKLGCQHSKPFNCKTCDLPIHVSSMNEHNKYHRNPKIARNEAILIQFIVKDNFDDAAATAKPNKRKITEEADEIPSKKTKLKNGKRRSERTMYYCIHCKCCIRGRKYIIYHYKGQCRNSSSTPYICKLCGLLISSGRHTQQHATDRGMKIGDLKFVRMQDNKTINPPIPEYPRCNKCEVHFISTVASEKHDCNDNSKTCRYCTKKFSDLAYKLHIPFHEYRGPPLSIIPRHRGVQSSSTPKKSKIPRKPATPKKPQGIDQELLKNYLLLTNTWNKLYLCQICDIACDSYDKMVEHSQNHYSNMESYDMTVTNCQICDLKFDSTCFEKHKELHFANKAIKKDSFKIFIYNYMYLATDDWYTLFGDLPKAEIDRIVSQSIYYYSRTVKMRVVEDGPPAHTLYQCAQCDKYVNPPTLALHYKYASCSNDVRKFHCRICDIYFASVSGRNHHSIAHRTKKKTFRTVLINENGDEEFNAAMRKPEQRAVKPVQKVTGGSKRLYTYYLCTACECCIKLTSKMRVHKCSTRRVSKKLCLKCGLQFTANKLYKHEAMHQTLPGFERKNMKIIRFDPRKPSRQQTAITSGEKVAKIYKCVCGLHFISSKTVNKHLEVCSSKPKISKENCSQCGLLFPTDALVSHLCSHHSNDKYSRFEVEEVTSGQKASVERDTPNMDNIKGIFKCTKCDLSFLSMYALKYHFGLNHKQKYKNTVRCNLCGLKFVTSSLKRHVDYHHTKLKCQLKDIRITAFGAGFSKLDGEKKRSFKLSKKFLSKLNLKMYSNNLYKCLSCAVHFLTKQTLITHLSTEQHKSRDSSTRIKCNICGLGFIYQSLPRHKYIHHEKLKLSLKHFVITAPFDITDHSNDIKENIVSEDNSILFKCLKCDVHFNTKHGFQQHLNNHVRVKSAVACTVCGLKFTANSLRRHVYIHHQMGNLKREDFCIKTNTKDVTSTQDTTFDDSQDSKTELAGLDTYEEEEWLELSDEEGDKADVSKKVNAVGGRIETNESHKADDWYERVVYKCGKCPVNFLTSNGLENHNEKRQHGLPKRECDTCHLMFTAQTLYKHQEFQHEKLNLKLEDLLIVCPMRSSENQTAIDSLIYSECLYKCNTCSIHLLTRGTFEEHVADCNGEARITQCIVCDLEFSEGSISMHFKIHHEILKLQKEEFNIVKQAELYATRKNIFLLDPDNAQKDTAEEEGASANSDDSVYLDDDEDENTVELGKNTHETGENSANVLSLKQLYRKHLFKCHTCSVHFMSESSLNNHVALNKHSSPKTTCCYCRLDFNSSHLIRHKEIHHMKMNLSLKDFKFIEQGQAAVVNNQLYKCTICHLHFVCESSHDGHTCISDVNVIVRGRCTKCGISFHLNSLRRHKYFHHDKMNLSREDFIIVVLRKDKNERSTDAIGLEHSYSDQLENAKVPEKHDCATYIEETKRRPYHLSKKQKSLINISLHNEYLYHCTKCNLHFMTDSALVKHRCLKAHCSPVKCTSCGLRFTAQSLAKHEYIHHEKLGLKLENLKIFNETVLKKESYSNISVDDASINNMEVDDNSSINTLNNEDSVDFRTEIDMTTEFPASTLVDGSNVPSLNKPKKLRSYTLPATFKAQLKLSLFSNTLHKCGICSMHYLDRVSLCKHICSCDGSIKNIKKCSVCGLAFSFITVEKHMYIHHEKLKFKREDMKVICRMEPAASEREKKTKVILKTYCRLTKNIGKTSTIEQVISKSSTNETEKVVSHDTIDIENETPMSESTTLQSETDDLAISLDESNDNITEVSASISNKRFDVSKSGIENSSDKNTSNQKVVVSESTSSDDTEFSIDEVNSTKDLVENDATIKTKYKVKLYKCGECNVYFMTQSTCYKHTIKHKSLHNLEFIDCKICGLAFRILSLHKHMSAHHKKEFKLEDVLIEEYQPNIQNRGTPKIDIYYAIDKVQSRLVSTTSEVSSKEIDSTEVNASNKQGEIVTNVPKIETNTREVTNLQEIVSKDSNTDTIHESAINCHKDNDAIVTESIENTTGNTDKGQIQPESEVSVDNDIVAEKNIVIDVHEPKPADKEAVTKQVIILGVNEQMTEEKHEKEVAVTHQDIDKLVHQATGVEINGPISSVNGDEEKYTER